MRWYGILFVAPVIVFACSNSKQETTCANDQDCPNGWFCSPAGICQEEGWCQTGQVLCGDTCVDLATSDDHCGTCDNHCSVYEFCVDGDCVCIPGYSSCLGECVNLDWNSGHCGQCGVACQGMEVCIRGDCSLGQTCEDLDLGLTTCGELCVNLENDPGHCGACSNACAADEICEGYVCQTEGECAEGCQGFTCCAGVCANLNNDILNCGACGQECPEHQLYCDMGACSTPPCIDGVDCGLDETCCDMVCCAADQLCCTVPGPVGSDTLCSEAGAETCPTGCVDCVCMAPDTPVATPAGYVPIANLRTGDRVYSVHNYSIRAVPVLLTNRTPVDHHRVVRVEFENGAVIEASRGHPTADGRIFAGLAVGDLIGGVGIVSTKVVEYRYDYTYDILPGSDTGSYFAAGVRIGSTLLDLGFKPREDSQ